MMMIDMRDSSRSRQSAGNTESDQKHSFPYPPSSSLGSHPDNSSAQQHNPILFDQITAEKINFTQKTPPLVTVPYTSISKFCRPSKAAYQTAGDKVAKYVPRDLRGWRALVTTANTILTNWATWYKLIALTGVCFLTTAIVFVTKSQKSIGDIDVTSRVQLLLSFVLAGYVSYYVNYYNSVRHQYLGSLWGACESVFLCAHQLFPGDGEQEMMLKNTVQRYTHSIFLLVFHACQGKTDFEFFYERKLLTSDEGTILAKASLGTRPLVIVGWLSRLFEVTQRMGYSNFTVDTQVLTAVSNLRGGVGGLLGVIGTPPPFMYTHLMYWIVQMFLLILAITTGINLAVFWDRKMNGDENYSYDDGDQWPHQPIVYYINFFCQQTAGNMIFAIFVEGLLYFCGEIENPLAGRAASFSEELYEVFLENNCIALAVGRESMETVLTIHEDKVSPIVKQNATGLPTEIVHHLLKKKLTEGGQDNPQNSNGNSLMMMKMMMKGGIKSIQEMNCNELCEIICNLGDVYIPYGTMMKQRGITGQIFLNITEEEFKSDFNITDKYHLKGLEGLKSSSIN